MQRKKDKKVPTVKGRIMELIKYKKIDVSTFFPKIELSYSNFKGKQLYSSPSSDVLVKIKSIFPDVNTDWLLTGEGSMFHNTSEPKELVEKQSYADVGLKDDTMTVAHLLEIVNKQVDIIKEQNREISRLRNRMSLVNSGIGFVGGGNLQNPPTPMPSQCGSAVENPSPEVQNPAKMSVEKRSRK